MFGQISCGKTRKEQKPSQDQLALGLALVITLLIIGGIEPNPGPGHGLTSDELYCEPGPSFVDATTMDMMEALRRTEFKLEKLSSDMSQLTNTVLELIHTSQQNRQVEMNPGNCHCNQNQTVPTARTDDCSNQPNRPINSELTGTHRLKPQEKKGGIRRVIVGGVNVSRLRDAAIESSDSRQETTFVRATSSNIWDILPAAVNKIKSKIDVVLHTGADLVLHHSSEFVMECISRQIDLVRGIDKNKRVFVCSIEERLDAGYHVFETARSVNSALGQLCEA